MRTQVRVLVGTALALALTACVVSPMPEELPAVALGQTNLYRLEVVLASFYGCLLLVTPAYSGLAAGRLPVEISTRGAKFAEEADRSAAVSRVRIEELLRTANDLTEALTAAELEIDSFRRSTKEDDTQREVDSKP